MELAQVGNKNCMRERVEITSYTFWHIWKVRNEWQFNRKECDPRELSNNAINELRQFHEAIAIKEAKEVRIGLLQTHEEWTKPEYGRIRLKASSLVEGKSKREL